MLSYTKARSEISSNRLGGFTRDGLSHSLLMDPYIRIFSRNLITEPPISPVPAIYVIGLLHLQQPGINSLPKPSTYRSINQPAIPNIHLDGQLLRINGYRSISRMTSHKSISNKMAWISTVHAPRFQRFMDYRQRCHKRRSMNCHSALDHTFRGNPNSIFYYDWRNN